MKLFIIGLILSCIFLSSKINAQSVNLASLVFLSSQQIYIKGITATQGISYYSGLLSLPATTSLPARNLHYLFMTSTNGANLPLTIFIANSILPGTSVLIDAFYNSGPFIIQNPTTGAQQTTLQYNSLSIISQSNILYIDVVAGVGYSTPQLNTYNDDQVANDAYLAIRQWIAMATYSSYANKGFNLMGTGYGGMIVPKVALLLNSNNVASFQGILIGNPTFQYDAIANFNQSFQNMFQFLASHNFIDQSSMSAFSTCILSTTQSNVNPMCTWLLQKFKQNFGRGINLWDVYGTNCFDDTLLPSMYTCLPLAPLQALLTSQATATALYVSLPLNGWNSFFNQAVINSYSFSYTSNMTTLQALTQLIGKTKVWVYDSDSSALNSFVNTRFYLNQLNLGAIITVQTPYSFLESTLLQDQLAGYITRYTGFVYATIKKGNFWAGQQQPLQYAALFKSYLTG